MGTVTNPRSVVSKLLLAAAATLGLLALTSAESDPGLAPEPPAKVNRYIGSDKCKSCHKSEASGDQFGKWSHEKHSKAYETLATPEAKAVGAKLGVADPQKSDKCLKCHTTAFGEPAEKIRRGFKIEKGVQCESCHGPGEDHMKARFAAAAGADDEEEGFGDDAGPSYTPIPKGEILLTTDMKTCLECHQEEGNPSFKPFCFHERSAKIRHLNPLKPRTAEELAALLVCGCEPCGCVHGCEEGECGVPPKPGGK